LLGFLLKALFKVGGKSKPAEVYPEVEKTVGLNPKDFPEEYEKYKSNAIKWKNKTAWAREAFVAFWLEMIVFRKT
jgi:hypothetical protein